MFYQVRRHLFSFVSLAIGALVFLALIVLSTNTASAAPVTDHLEACRLEVSNRLASVSNFIDLGSEVDARLENELEAARCTVAELEQDFDHTLDSFLPQESLQEVSQGLDQDLRLSEEISAMREVTARFSVRQGSDAQMARQIFAQEARDAILVAEVVSGLDRGLEQDLRLGAELSASREAVASLNAR